MNKTLKISAVLLLLIALFAVSTAFADGTSLIIRIPSIGVDAPIIDVYIREFPNGAVTWDVSGITQEVGLFDGLSRFGEGSNVGLGGHSVLEDGRPAVFYELDKVAVGDEIIILVDGAEQRYTVTATTVVGYTDLSIFYPTDAERLTIITCDVNSYNGSAYENRVVVIAEPVAVVQ